MKSGKRIENPGKVFKRLMQYVMKSYGPHLVIVAVLIFVSVLANVQGTMFIQRLPRWRAPSRKWRACIW